MEIAQLVFTILIWVWLVGIFGKLSDIHKLGVHYAQLRVDEMKVFYGSDRDPGEIGEDKK